MKIFKEPNMSFGFVCPICKKSTVLPITLVGVLSTVKDGKMEAIQVHIDCLNLVVIEDEGAGKKAIFHSGDIG